MCVCNSHVLLARHDQNHIIHKMERFVNDIHTLRDYTGFSSVHKDAGLIAGDRTSSIIIREHPRGFDGKG